MRAALSIIIFCFLTTSWLQAQEAPNSPQSFQKFLSQLENIQSKEKRPEARIIPNLKRLIPQAKFPYQNMLQSLLADNYYSYFLRNYQRLYEYPKDDSPSEDYREWNPNRFRKEISLLHKKAIEDDSLLWASKTRDFSPLWSTATIALQNQPSLFEVLAHRALDYFEDRPSDDPTSLSPFFLRSRRAFVPVDSFLTFSFRSKDPYAGSYQAVQLHQKLLEKQLEREELFSLIATDVRRLQFARKRATGQLHRQRYASALQDILSRKLKHPSMAEVQYELAKLYVERAQGYNPPAINDFQWDYKAARDICLRVVKDYPKTEAADKAKALLEIIKAQKLSVEVEEVHPAQMPLRIKVNYRNLSQVVIRIIHLTANDDKGLEELKEEGQLDLLKRLPVHAQSIQGLPDQEDFQMHGIEVPIEGLELGKYVIWLSSDGKFNLESGLHSWSRLHISNLALMESSISREKKNYVVVDRWTGTPIPNVQIKHREKPLDGGEWQSFPTEKTLENGRYDLDIKKGFRGEIELDFSLGQDSIRDWMRYRLSNFTSRHRVVCKLLTDQKSYQPGDRFSFGGFAYWDAEGPRYTIKDTSIRIRLLNEEEELLRDTMVRVNSRGAFAGSFLLPEYETGKFILISPGASMLVLVEHPEPMTYGVQMENNREDFHYWDTIEVKGKIVPFVGAEFPETSLKYKVVRQNLYPYWYSYFWWRPELPNERSLIANGQLIPDQDGSFRIPFVAIPDLELGDKYKVTYNYTISVQATDDFGEEQFDTLEVRVGNPNLALEVDVASVSPVKDPLEVKIRTRTLNGMPLNNQGRLRIFSLEKPSVLYRPRRWTQPDLHVIGDSDYAKSFPNDIYGYEDDFHAWRTKEVVIDTAYDTGLDSAWVYKELARHPAGKYRIRIDTHDADSNKLKVVRHISRYNALAIQPEVPEILRLNVDQLEASPGETVNLRLQTSQRGLWIWLEWGQGTNVDSVMQIQLDQYNAYIEIPVLEKYKGGFDIHASTILHNEFYSFKQSIRVPIFSNPIDLDIVLDKNQAPGQSISASINTESPGTLFLQAGHPIRSLPRIRNMNIIRRSPRVRGWAENGFWIGTEEQLGNVDLGSIEDLRFSSPFLSWNNAQLKKTAKDLSQLVDRIYKTERYRQTTTFREERMSRGVFGLIGLEKDRKERLQLDYLKHLVEGPPQQELVVESIIDKPASFLGLQSYALDSLSKSIPLPSSPSKFPGKIKLRAIAFDDQMQSKVEELEVHGKPAVAISIDQPSILMAGDQWNTRVKLYNFTSRPQKGELHFQYQFYRNDSLISTHTPPAQSIDLAAKSAYGQLSWPVEISDLATSLQVQTRLDIQENMSFEDSMEIPLQPLTTSQYEAQYIDLSGKKKWLSRVQPTDEKPEVFKLEFRTEPIQFAIPVLKDLAEQAGTDATSLSQRIFALQILKELEPNSVSKHELLDLVRMLKTLQQANGGFAWQHGFEAHRAISVEVWTLLNWLESNRFPSWEDDERYQGMKTLGLAYLDSLGLQINVIDQKATRTHLNEALSKLADEQLTQKEQVAVIQDIVNFPLGSYEVQPFKLKVGAFKLKEDPNANSWMQSFSGENLFSKKGKLKLRFLNKEITNMSVWAKVIRSYPLEAPLPDKNEGRIQVQQAYLPNTNQLLIRLIVPEDQAYVKVLHSTLPQYQLEWSEGFVEEEEWSYWLRTTAEGLELNGVEVKAGEYELLLPARKVAEGRF